VPERLTPLTTSGAVPPLVTVTVCALLVVFRSWFENASELLSTTIDGTVPTPERGTEADTAIVLLL
jgi:hypothetical protein